MFARKGVFSSIGRAGAAATVVAMALTAVQPSSAFAGSASSTKGVTRFDRNQRRNRYQRAPQVLPRRRWCRGGGGLCRHRRHGACDCGRPESARLLL
jgi:hypothetical protein